MKEAVEKILQKHQKQKMTKPSKAPKPESGRSPLSAAEARRIASEAVADCAREALESGCLDYAGSDVTLVDALVENLPSGQRRAAAKQIRRAFETIVNELYAQGEPE